MNTALAAPLDSFEADAAKSERAEAAAPPVSRQSVIGLNAANFFLAEVTGVVMPFLGDYLKEQSWSEVSIGLGISCAGLGVFLMQTPAGMITDRVCQRRTLLAGASLILGDKGAIPVRDLPTIMFLAWGIWQGAMSTAVLIQYRRAG